MENCKDIISDANNLYQGFKDTKKSSGWKDATQKFELNWLLEIAKLQNELQDFTYESGGKSTFVLNERGKTRLIHGSIVRDRVVRHALCDNYLVPTLRTKLVYDNCASLPDKGIDMCRRRLKVHLQKFYRKYGTNEGYILLVDFSGYYDNLHHDKVLKSVGDVIKDEYCIEFLKNVFKTFEPDVSYLSEEDFDNAMETKFSALDNHKLLLSSKMHGEKFLKKSVDIGDQCSQIIGVYYPTRIDNYIKTVCGEKFYGRYMDDFYIISNSKEHLNELLIEIKKIADSMGIIINLKKTRICKLSRRFTFLQHRYALTCSGKIVEKVNPKRVTTTRRKLKKLHKKLINNQLDFSYIEMFYKSWRGTYAKVLTKKQLNELDCLYNSLYIDYIKRSV